MFIPKTLILASGTSIGGGTGFENLVKHVLQHRLNAEIVGVASNHLNGGVREKAEAYGIDFFHLPDPWTAEGYQRLVAHTKAQFVFLSGWLKPVYGLDPGKVVNIHPCILPEFGGRGMYGHHAHEAVLKSARNGGRWTHTEVCMHFVTERYDEGPIIFRRAVPILSEDTIDSLATRVNAVEHEFQPIITHMVANGIISWDGIEGHEPSFPLGYNWHKRADLKGPHAKPDEHSSPKRARTLQALPAA